MSDKEQTVKTSIFETLEKLNLTSIETRTLYSNRTRDVENLKVWRDEVSGVIYIDDFYTGDETYTEGTYREEEGLNFQTGKRDYEEITDSTRKFESNLNFVAGKRVVDFGCGSGDFLRLVRNHCAEVCGIELQQDYVDALNADGIRCESNLGLIQSNSTDVCVSFHVLEHLPNPLETLKLLKEKIVVGGMILIEVPHANDFLLSTLCNENFKQFTLWSQHLVLHTRESLRRMLNYVGFEDIRIEGVQRYPLSNHLNWMAKGKGGGHKSPLSLIDSPSMINAYSDSLARMNETDTLVAIAKVS
jgi:2-polyprenyl-3-methyl-5-hydroxy-6-metoxy-1,4-benzoquinol methylase